jgi:concanavalin A-like lectin/glucanase superfamily protein
VAQRAHRSERLALLFLALPAACALDTAGRGSAGAIDPGSGETAATDAGSPATDAGHGFLEEDAGSDGGATDGGVAEAGIVDAAADGDAAGPPCTTGAPSMVGWWPADGDMADRVAGHAGTSGTQGGATAVMFGPGKVAGAFDLEGTSYVQIPNAPSFQITAAITIEAWILANALGGRIVDKITAGGADGYLLDTYANKLRLIVGSTHLSTASSLPTGAWVHVAGTWDGTTGRLFVNGSVAGSAAIAGPLPTTSLPLRIGADSNGENRFSGKIDEVALYNRALTTAEIGAIVAAGPHGRCKP